MKNQNLLFPLPDAELPAKFSAFLIAQVDASHRSGYPKRGGGRETGTDESKIRAAKDEQEKWKEMLQLKAK